MSEPETVSLDDLFGEHTLDGVDTLSERVLQWGGHFEDCSVIRFRLDGIIYTAVEDPSDGYRSSMDKLFKSPNEKMLNTFPATRVLAKKKDNETYQVNDTLQLIDVVTGKVVLEVGTDNTDDYYPYFVSAFHPEHLAINEPLSKGKEGEQ